MTISSLGFFLTGDRDPEAPAERFDGLYELERDIGLDSAERPLLAGSGLTARTSAERETSSWGASSSTFATRYALYSHTLDASYYRCQ